ncbi:hypothetical protein HNP38_002769 [Chryseobacterium defluvii]|uniref:Uncharacterized protein n=1 Tax=Chryseobacterium defluvii TaxID=160396 RepID=A0A840KIY8_9FLAO|nr:hypothetical protein [Chryseobacterium defluvii]MBB4807463.1 hypothetical protein [Chryseobacterium defluvii]
MESLKKLLNRFPVVLDTAKVVSITDDKCHVISLTTGNDFRKCSINSIIENRNNKLLIYPKINSVVTIGIYSTNNKAVIVSVSEVEKIYFRNEKSDFTFDSSGFQFNRDGENLKEVLNGFQDGFGKLCDELAKVVVSIGVTPDVPAIMQIKNNIVNTNKQALNKILT